MIFILVFLGAIITGLIGLLLAWFITRTDRKDEYQQWQHDW